VSVEQKLRDLAERWKDVPAGERANYQLYLTEFASALDVPTPQPKGSGYEFEYPVQVVNADGSTTTKFVDLYRAGHFVLEAKDEDSAESSDVLLVQGHPDLRSWGTPTFAHPLVQVFLISPPLSGGGEAPGAWGSRRRSSSRRR